MLQGHSLLSGQNGGADRSDVMEVRPKRPSQPLPSLLGRSKRQGDHDTGEEDLYSSDSSTSSSRMMYFVPEMKPTKTKSDQPNIGSFDTADTSALYSQSLFSDWSQVESRSEADACSCPFDELSVISKHEDDEEDAEFASWAILAHPTRNMESRGSTDPSKESKTDVETPSSAIDGDAGEVTMISYRPTVSESSSYSQSRKRRRQAIVLLCLLLIGAVLAALILGLRNFRSTPTELPNNVIGTSPPPSDDENANTPQPQQDTVYVPTSYPTQDMFPSSKPSMVPSLESPGPSGEPSPSPSSSPTFSPTRCQNSLSVDKACYVQGLDTIVVTFSQCVPREDDWIGFFLENSNPQGLGDNYVEWSWACGSKLCQGATFKNSINIDANIAFGSYVAFLVRDNPFGAPYSSDGMSNTFSVAQAC